MGGGSSKTKSSGKSSTKPWEQQSQYLSQLYGGAADNLNQDYQYGDDRFAGMGANTRQAVGDSAGMYGQGAGNVNAASNEFGKTMSGQYLDPNSNPFLQANYDKGARNITNSFMDATQSLGSRMAGANRSGSGAENYRQNQNQENLATGLGDFGAQLYGENYSRERGNMMGAMGQAGAINQAGWQNVAGMSASGDREQADRQGVLDDTNARFQFAQNARATKLGEFRDLIGGPVMTTESEQVSKSKEAHGGILSS